MKHFPSKNDEKEKKLEKKSEWATKPELIHFERNAQQLRDRT